MGDAGSGREVGAGGLFPGELTENQSCGTGGDDVLPASLNHISPIQTGLTGEYPLTLQGRLFLGLFGGSLVVLFAIASCLTPDPQGFGTHRQMGLPPCSIQTLYGIPCPTCGMTTAFAHFVRGELVSASQANPGGFLAASSCVLLLPWSIAGIVRGRLLWVRSPVESAVILLAVLVGVSLLSWATRFL